MQGLWVLGHTKVSFKFTSCTRPPKCWPSLCLSPRDMKVSLPPYVLLPQGCLSPRTLIRALVLERSVPLMSSAQSLLCPVCSSVSNSGGVLPVMSGRGGVGLPAHPTLNWKSSKELVSTKNVYRWQISIWEYAQHIKSLGKCKLKQQWDTTSHLLEQLNPTCWHQVLDRMQSKRDACPLLVGMQNGTALRDSLAISYKARWSYHIT